MNRAAFLDRDGVINRKAPEGHYVTRWEEMYFLPGAAQAIALLNKAGFRVIVVTNQRCVAKGLVTAADMESMHRQMCVELARENATVEAVYYCPHENHPRCDCRKPAPGMLLHAARAHEIDLNRSWMIGDSEVDVEAGRNAGCKTARLQASNKIAASRADVVASSLLEATRRILELEESQTGGSRPQQHHQPSTLGGNSLSPIQTKDDQPTHRSNARMVALFCMSVACLLLIAGLWPLRAPRNEVEWLSSNNGLRLGRYGSVVSSGKFGGGATPQGEAGSVEIWLVPNHPDDRSTILAFDGAGNGTVPFSLEQHDRDLVVKREVVDPQGATQTAVLQVNSVFRGNESRFLTITLGEQSASVYVDGTLAEVSPALGSTSNSLTGKMVVANSPVRHSSWSGQVLGLAVYHRELTSAEVKQQYETWVKNRPPAFPQHQAQAAVYLFSEHAGDTVRNQVDAANGLIIPRNYFVLHPPFWTMPWRADDSDWGRLKDITINVVGFVPFGFSVFAYLPSVRRRNRRAMAALASGFVLSVTLETLQAYLPTRDSDITDVLANTLGTGAGVMFCRWSAMPWLVWRGLSAAFLVEGHSANETIRKKEVRPGLQREPGLGLAFLPKEATDLNNTAPLNARPDPSAFTVTDGSAEALSRAVRNRYRCPQSFLDFALSGPLSSDHGFFRFGTNAICYGRSCSGTRERHATSSLHDILQDVVSEETKLRLPFDPTEVIGNLRLEQYVEREGDTGVQTLLRKLYYLVRPFTNLWMRKQIQKFHARNWKKSHFPEWPVDTTVENICETLLSLSLKSKGVEAVPFVWFWPKGARGCLLMTHDVETTAGRDFCAELMDIDESFGIKASFQVVPEERYHVPPEFLDAMRARGFEVVIHDLNHDGKLFGTREEFLRRAAIINRYATKYGAKGFRAAVLYRNPEWYGSFDFSFDMSFPNVAHLDPQAGGCCTVMPYFIGDTLEVPVTTTQDYTLFYLLNERSIELWKVQIDRILQKNGLVSFIVHPDYVMEHDTKSVYKELLAYLRSLCEKEDIWCAVPSDVDRWWRARSKMSVVQHGNSWRIEGEGAEDALLAYAKNVDGNIVYELEKAAVTT